MPVRDLHNMCETQLGWSFSSTRKTMTRMVDKGFVVLEKPEDKPVAVYAPRVSKTTTLAHISRDFMRRVLEIDGALPEALFSQSKILSDEELDELEGLLGL